MRTLLLCFSLFFLFNLLSAQAPGVSLSEPYKFDKTLSLSTNILAVDDKYVVTLFDYSNAETLVGTMLRKRSKMERGPKRMLLMTHDADLSGRQEQVIELDGERTGNSLSSLEENLLWIYRTQRDKDAPVVVKAEILSPAGKRIGEPVKLLSYKPDEAGSVYRLSARSLDRSKFVHVFTEESTNRLLSKNDDSKASITFAVFDNDGRLLSSNEKRLSVARDRLDMLSVGVNNDGDAYVVARIYSSGKKKESKKGSDATLQVYSLAAGSEEVVTTRHRTSGMYIANASLVPDSDGSVRLFGMYSEERDKELTGYYYLSDPSTSATIKPRAFTKTELEAMGPRVTRTKKGKLIIEGNFEYRDAVRRPDGSLVILLEDYRYTPGSYNANTGRTSPPRYSFFEGLQLDLSAGGELQNHVVFPKAQTSTGGISPYMRMTLVGYDGRPAVVYNDNALNIGRDLEKRTKPLRAQNAVGMIAYANDKNELVRQPLFARSETDKMLINPQSSTQLANGDVVFFTYRFKFFGKESYRLGRLAAGHRK